MVEHNCNPRIQEVKAEGKFKNRLELHLEICLKQTITKRTQLPDRNKQSVTVTKQKNYEISNYSFNMQDI